MNDGDFPFTGKKILDMITEDHKVSQAEQKRRMRVAKDILIAASHLEMFYDEPELAGALKKVANDISSGRRKARTTPLLDP